MWAAKGSSQIKVSVYSLKQHAGLSAIPLSSLKNVQRVSESPSERFELGA